MERFKRFCVRLLFPGGGAVLASVPVSAALLGYTFLANAKDSPLAYAAYAVSAYSLAIVCAYIIKAPKPDVKAALHRSPCAHRYLTDVSFRTSVSLYLSLGINLAFAAMKLFLGVRCRSVWFGTLAVYYSLLAVMRFLLLQHLNRIGIGKDYASELRQYRACGIMLLLMNVALLGVVILAVTENEGFRYDGYLIYAAAAYAFYNIISAVRDLIRYRQLHNPVLSAAKAVKLAAALVSMLALETAMLAQFGQESGAPFRLVMTGLTGSGVCLLVLAMAVAMVAQSTGRLKKLNGRPKTEAPQ